MKTFYLRLLVSILLLTPFSCKKFLNEKPVSLITTDNAYTTSANIEAALNGAYSSFIGYDYYQWEYVMESDAHSDNAYSAGSGDPDFLQSDLFTISNANGLVYRDWAQLYASIAKCNVVIDNIIQVTDPKLTPGRRQQIIGEASFLRAFHYFQLVKQWGAVPLEKHSNSAQTAAIDLPRSADTTVYNFINADLQVAISNLPDDFGDASIDKVRATKGAANALLAKMWAQRPDRDYNKVLGYANAVINSPAGYSLLSEYTALFDGNNNYNSESILEIPYIASTPEACWGTELFYPTHDDNGNVPPDAWQRYCTPSKTLVQAYQNMGDSIRLHANISFEYVPWADKNWNPCADPTIKVPFNVKSKHPNNWSGGDHPYLLRLADILLLKAEALNETGDANGAADALNVVRLRAQLPPVVAGSQDDMRHAILLERQLELAFEGQRWDDLVRYNAATTVMQGLSEFEYTCNNGAESTPIPIIYNVTPGKWVLPIPLLEMQANPNLTQNPGY